MDALIVNELQNTLSKITTFSQLHIIQAYAITGSIDTIVRCVNVAQLTGRDIRQTCRDFKNIQDKENFDIIQMRAELKRLKNRNWWQRLLNK